MNNESISKYPVVTLKSGLRVANFSSDHPYKFTDGSYLAPCDKKRAVALKLDILEHLIEEDRRGFKSVRLQIKLLPLVEYEIQRVHEDSEVDIAIAPLMIMEACRELPIYRSANFKMRSIRHESKKLHGHSPPLCLTDKFCL